MVVNMKKRIKTKGIIIVLGLCLVQSCIQQEDLFRPPEPEIINYVTPLYTYSSFSVQSGSISMTSDGSLIVVRHTFEGLYLFNLSGEVVWSNNEFGGIHPVITRDGSYLITENRGYTKEDPFFLIKIDREGNIVWKREIGLIGFDGLAITPDASFVAVGYIDENKRGHLVLFDRDGTTVWNHQIDGRIETVAVSTSGYVVAGPRDMYIYLYDCTGELIFTYLTNSYFDSQDVVIAPDESFFLFGSEHTYLNCYTLNGNLLWQTEVGPICNVRISADGEYIAAATNNSRLLLLDKNGNVLWEKKVTDAYFIDEVAISAHGEYIAVDTMVDYSFWLSKWYLEVYSKGGNFLWRYEVDTPIMAIAMSDDGHYIAAGSKDVFVLFDNFQAIEEYALSKSFWVIQSVIHHSLMAPHLQRLKR